MLEIKHIILLYCAAWIFLSCATPRSPEGGPKDTQAPQIDSTQTTPNLQTNFKKQTIEITFDEWVKLNDVFNQVVISPPLEKKPTVTLKRKTVRFEFDEDEVLRENATYTINFGDAIQDITERNTVPDLRYVFSTGDKIDSLQVSGKVVDFLTQEAAKDVLVMLYENTQDSVVRTERPFYFAKTNDAGTFKINNIKEGTFKVFALKDANLNYKFDQETELIGFRESLITLPDTTNTPLELSVFQEETQLRLNDDELVHYGLAKLTFNRNPYDLNLAFDNITPAPYTEIIKDSLKIWYNTDEYFDIRIQADTSLNDTIRVQQKGKADFLASTKFRHLNGGINGRVKSKNPTVPIGIEMNHPILNFNKDSIFVYEDTLQTRVYPQIRVDSVDNRLLKLDFAWKDLQTYEVNIRPNSMTSIFNIPNDTIQQGYKTLAKIDFGDLTVTVDSLDSSKSYLISLKTLTKELVEKTSVTRKSVYTKTYTTLAPNEYLIEIIEDRNQNGRWDTGNYDEQLQPERIFSEKLEQLRANWTVEAKVVLKY